MYLNIYEESVVQGLDHTGGWAEHPIQNALNLLKSGEGSRSGCLSSIARFSKSWCMVSQFRDRDLGAVKQWAYAAAKSKILQQHLSPSDTYLSEDLLWPLISDNEEVIDWYRQNHAMYHPEKPSAAGGDKDNPKSWMYYRYQSWLALNARWDELGERCERILSMKDEIKKDRAYLIDHQFYLALARGDQAMMESLLFEKCAPKNRKLRYDQESGLTNNFIVSYATLFAKLAWRHGYELEVDTPWIPKDWLPIRPNAKYEDPWPFMQRFGIWQPFPEPWSRYSPQCPAS